MIIKWISRNILFACDLGYWNLLVRYMEGKSMEFCAHRSSLIYLLFFFPEGVDKASYWKIDLDLLFIRLMAVARLFVISKHGGSEDRLFQHYF